MRDVEKFPFCPHGLPLEDTLFVTSKYMVLWKTTGEVVAIERSEPCLEKEKPSPSQKSHFLGKIRA